jgi:hypothetical protein
MGRTACVRVGMGLLERREGSRGSTKGMFFFFSNRMGLIGSLLVSAVLTLVLLAFCNVI